jgi:hypothetical protein
MDNAARNVRSYVKKTIVQVPETADYITRFLPSAPNSLLLSSQDQPPESSPTTLLSPLLDSPFHELGYLSGSSSQLRMIQSPQDDTQRLASKFRRMEELLKDSGFDSVGELLKVLFYNPSRTSGESDPRGTFHVKAISRFLQGRNKVKMSDIITLIYKHKHSAPSPGSPQYSERHAPFSAAVSPAEISHARPSLFTWATNLVADHACHEIYGLTGKDDHVHLRASTNGRHPDRVNLVTWSALGNFSIASLCEKYKSRAPVSWHLTESMAASRKNGIVVLKKRRPHPIVSAN